MRKGFIRFNKIKSSMIFSMVCLSILCSTSCHTTVDLEKAYLDDKTDSSLIRDTEKQVLDIKQKEIEDERKGFDLIQNPDGSMTIMIVPPNIIKTSESNMDTDAEKEIKGKEALISDYKNKIVEPSFKEGILKGWLFQNEKIYQVHTRTYHSTIIQLEPGEEMLETPYLSEPDVWRISRGMGIVDGQPTQYLMLKPDYSGLNSTLVIITNRRIYQLEISSYKDHYMPYVKWIYRRQVEDSASWLKHQMELFNEHQKQKEEGKKQFIIHNYKMTLSSRKITWKPTAVYDDGQKTYFVLDRKTLNTKLPAIFNDSREIINYEVKDNVLIVNQLIEKVTLRLGKQTVTIQKKKGIGKELKKAKETQK